MKKLIAIVLSIVMIFALSVTAFAADSPTATSKITITIRKALVADQEYKADVEYTVDGEKVFVFKADTKYGKFDNWTFYSEDGKALTEGTDYEIVAGSLNASEISIKFKKSVVVCANYDNVKTDPALPSSGDGSANAPQTGDATATYAVVIMLGIVAFAFGAKKVYSK